MGFGDDFMEMAHGWNRYVSGFGHEIAGGAEYMWNGGSVLDPDKQPAVDDAACLQGRIEGGMEYNYGGELKDSGKQSMGTGIGGMGRDIWGGITGLFSGGDSSGGAAGAGGAPPVSAAGSSSGSGAGAGSGGGPATSPTAETYSD